LRYNYFVLINNTNNRNFISLGVNTSIPIRIFSKPYKAYHFHQQSLNWSQKKTKDNVQWLEISNLIYEFKYKLKQFAAWEEKQRIQKESLRIYQGLHQINDPSFHPIEALDALDAYYALELEKMDLLQQLYIKLGEIQVLLPQESVNRYIIPYQKQAQTTEWLTDVHTNSFIYTRGVIQSNDNEKEKVQIIIKDSKTDEIVGDVITTLPKGKFEVYFPKSGTYQYLIKLSNQNVLKGEFSIPDSSQFPAFMDQNVKINRQPNGKFELLIETGALDSISVGIEKAKSDVSEIIQNPTNPSQRYNYNDDAREQLAMQTNLQSSRFVDAPNTSETTQTASVQNLKESNNESRGDRARPPLRQADDANDRPDGGDADGPAVIDRSALTAPTEPSQPTP
jgi:hypothetical protein